MPQAVWSGDLSFGLVNIPIKLYSATAPKQVRFHQYEAGTGRRIRYARVATGPTPAYVPEPTDQTGTQGTPPGRETEPAAPTERTESDAPEPRSIDSPAPEPAGDPARRDDEVAWEEVVKGFEIEPGRVVTVTPEELVSVAPERSRLLEVEQFVNLSDIDPVYFDKSYYVVPQGRRGTERPYWLLYRAMESAGKVAVGRFVMRTKEYLVAIRPAEHVLMLETLFYADEVRDPKAVWFPLVEEPPERELRMAQNLVEAMAGDWEPARHRDRYRERLLELLHNKADEALVLPEPEEEAPTETVTDLMNALEASIEAAKQARSGEGKGTGEAS
jgi:DNA end-binding protein Ku